RLARSPVKSMRCAKKHGAGTAGASAPLGNAALSVTRIWCTAHACRSVVKVEWKYSARRFALRSLRLSMKSTSDDLRELPLKSKIERSFAPKLERQACTMRLSTVVTPVGESACRRTGEPQASGPTGGFFSLGVSLRRTRRNG